jgi:hypothetical protein
MNLSAFFGVTVAFLIGVLAGKAKQRPVVVQHRTFIVHDPVDHWHSRMGGVN